MLSTRCCFFCRRSLHAQHQAKVEEAVEQAKALRKAMKAGHVAAQVNSSQIIILL